MRRKKLITISELLCLVGTIFFSCLARAEYCGKKDGIRLPCWTEFAEHNSNGFGPIPNNSLPIYPYARRPNGCSIPGLAPGKWDDWALSAFGIGFRASFRDACNHHDICYYTLGTSPSRCNDAFQASLRSACEKGMDSAGGILVTIGSVGSVLASCYAKAETFWAVVKANENKYHHEAQDLQKSYLEKVNAYVTKKTPITDFSSDPEGNVLVCNESSYQLVHVALGYRLQMGGTVHTKGWWRIPQNECQNIGVSKASFDIGYELYANAFENGVSVHWGREGYSRPIDTQIGSFSLSQGSVNCEEERQRCRTFFTTLRRREIYLDDSFTRHNLLNSRREDVVVSIFEPEMVSLCMSNGGGPDCFRNQWNRSFYESLVKERKSVAASRDGCVNSPQNVCGPFPESAVIQCFQNGGGQPCFLNRWNRKFFNDIAYSIKIPPDNNYETNGKMCGYFDPELKSTCRLLGGGEIPCNYQCWNLDFYYDILKALGREIYWR